MKPFVVNRYGRIVFPFNFFPALDFSVFETLEQFSAVIRRDFEEKAPTEADIVARLDAGGYKGRYELLRDLADQLLVLPAELAGHQLLGEDHQLDGALDALELLADGDLIALGEKWHGFSI